ncbi:hypothetical protein B5S30_g5326 [[Candida] boidinii]|nr:hypothetical protein B5S30_g5326 [[Candida] boidinii]
MSEFGFPDLPDYLKFSNAEEAAAPYYNYQKLFTSFVFGSLFIVILAYKSIETVVGRFLNVPPDNWRDVIKSAFNEYDQLQTTGNDDDKKEVTPKRSIVLKSSAIGVKIASYRRRLVLGSIKPSLYSTVPLSTTETTDSSNPVYSNKLRVNKIDLENGYDKFYDSMKPIESTNLKFRRILFGFFHPNGDCKGGGEKVLWESIYSTLLKDKLNIAVLYTFTQNNKVSCSSILNEVKSTFSIDFFAKDELFDDGAGDGDVDHLLLDRLVFVQLPNKYKWLIDGKSWKFLTIIGQAIGSIIVTWLAINSINPDVWIDTMGLPFSYPFISCFDKLPVVSYVHYPLISSDMFKKIDDTKSKLSISSNGFLNYIRILVFVNLKYYYWKIMRFVYAFCGSYSNLVCCNSTWTYNHIKSVWKLNNHQGSYYNRNFETIILYPPILNSNEEKAIKEIPDDVFNTRERNVVYLAQFRPEKRHELVIDQYIAYYKWLQNSPHKEVEVEIEPLKLILIGSVRDEDSNYINELTAKIDKVNNEIIKVAEKFIELKVNLRKSELINDYLLKSEFGLNAMWNEHFGIVIAEYLAYGLIPISHSSAGPLLDIVVPYDEVKNEELKDGDGCKFSKRDLQQLEDSMGGIEDSEAGKFASGFFFKDSSDVDYSNEDNDSNQSLQLSDCFKLVSLLPCKYKNQLRLKNLKLYDLRFNSLNYSKIWGDKILKPIKLLEIENRDSKGKVEKVY